MQMESLSRVPLWHLAVERHADGGKHWHVMCIWDEVFNTRRAHELFDIDGVHPNFKRYVLY